MAQVEHGAAASAATYPVPESDAGTSPMEKRMVAMMEEMAAMRAEMFQLRSEKAKAYKKDEDSLPYTADNTPDKSLARPLFADGAWIGRGATTFAMTPQHGAASKPAASSPWPEEWERMWDRDQKPNDPPGFAQWREPPPVEPRQPPPVEPQPWRVQAWEYDPWADYHAKGAQGPQPWRLYSGGRGGDGNN